MILLDKGRFLVEFEPEAEMVIKTIRDVDGVMLNETERWYVNFIVSGLKGIGVWHKMKALYGFVGGTAATYKWNWKDMRDLDEAFRLTWGTGVAYDSGGAKGDASSITANTHFNPYLNLSQFSGHASFYTSTAIPENSVDIDCYPNDGLFFDVYVLNGVAYSVFNSSDNFAVGTPNTNNGFYIATRTSATTNLLAKNDTFLDLQTANNVGQLPNAKVTIGGRLDTGYYSSKVYSFVSVGDGLTQIECLQMSHIITTAQRILGRQS